MSATPVLPAISEAEARRTLVSKPHVAALIATPRTLTSYAAVRLREGWFLTATSETRAECSGGPDPLNWVVADNGRSCHQSNPSDPEWLVANLMADSRPSVAYEDAILCTCGHLSAQHGAGTPSPNPISGSISGIGRGPCGHVEPSDYSNPRTGRPEDNPCACTALIPAPDEQTSQTAFPNGPHS